MAKKVKLGSAKRFGPRYGARNRDRLASVENEHRGLHKCPFCHYIKVKRVSRGIWKCEKCNANFTGKAYTFETKKKKSADLLKKHKEKVKDEDFDDYEEAEEEPVEKDDSDVSQEDEPAEDETEVVA